jgi:NAD-dependent dihydropyrimidine dehydrogenase PreA subunit
MTSPAGSGPPTPWRHPTRLAMYRAMVAPRLSHRHLVDHRPERDPECAGCPQLGLLRALRRCRIEATGRLGCEPGYDLLLADQSLGESRIRILAGPVEPDPRLLPAGVALRRLDPSDLEGTERALWAARSWPGDTVFLAITPCVLEGPRRAPFVVAEARCNRCGQCLSLNCPAISDQGGEAMVIDQATCTGCGLCLPICRGQAIGPRLRVLE